MERHTYIRMYTGRITAEKLDCMLASSCRALLDNHSMLFTRMKSPAAEGSCGHMAV